MAYWSAFYFMDSLSPVMEEMFMFHDHVMIVLFMILIFMLLSIININNVKIINMNLLESQSVELVWTIFPVFLLIFIILPSMRLLYLMEESYFPDMTIKIMGHQWYWSYDYPEFDLEFESFMVKNLEYYDDFRLLETDNYLFLPMNVMVRFLVSSVDVIHSWTVQSLGVKSDAIPGRLNQVNAISLRSGTYYGQCSEICGSNHSFMPISLMVMDMDDFIYLMT